jgi:SnoaL-like domain
MPGAGPDSEGREWLDRLAIQDLIYRYSDAVTRADWRQCEAVFAPDARWECPAMDVAFDSRAAFMEYLLPTAELQVLIQTAHSPVITLTGPHSARATTTIHELVKGVAATGSAVNAAGEDVNSDQWGIYFDEVARLDGEWKFTHRRFVLLYIRRGGVAGDVLAQRSSLSAPADNPTD